MLLKKFSYLLLAGALTTFVACSEDEPVAPADTTLPVLTSATNPTAAMLAAGVQGGSLEVDAVVTDDTGLQSATLVVTGPNNGATWFSEDWTATEINGKVLTVDKTIAIPATAPVGTSTITLTATDMAGNDFVQTWPLVVSAPATSAVFNVTIPAAITEDLYIAGELADASGAAVTWNEPGTNANLVLTRVDDTNYTITVPFLDTNETPGEIEFKIFRGTGWSNGQVNADCAGPNQKFVLPLSSAVNTVPVTVIAWSTECGG